LWVASNIPEKATTRSAATKKGRARRVVTGRLARGFPFFDSLGRSVIRAFAEGRGSIVPVLFADGLMALTGTTIFGRAAGGTSP
jgi:hypothetical protein